MSSDLSRGSMFRLPKGRGHENGRNFNLTTDHEYGVASHNVQT